MSTKKERQEFFHDIISRNREEIISGWVDHLRLREEYALLPEKELGENIRNDLKRNEAYLCGKNIVPLDTQVELASKRRVAERLALSALLHAVEGFRVVIIPLILKEADPENLEGLCVDLCAAISCQQKDLIDEYQTRQKAIIKEKVAELKGATEIRNNLFSNVGHELRTPLTVIQGFSKLLESGAAPPEDVKKLAGKIYEAGESLLGLVSDLILISKLRGKTIKAGNALICINDLSEGAHRDARSGSDDNQHIWEKKYMDNNPMVIGDVEMLTIMLTHIIKNAVKFSPTKSMITIATRVDKDFTYVDLMDEGIGIESDDLDFIFENFSQKESHSSRQFGGAGIGLHLARQVAWLHGGDIMAARREGEPGSVFTVSLPLAKRPSIC